MIYVVIVIAVAVVALGAWCLNVLIGDEDQEWPQ